MTTPSKITPKRRFISGILPGRTDRSPVGSVTSVDNVTQMEMAGAYFPEAHLDGEKMARLAAGAHDILGYDASMPDFSMQAAAAALGCEVEWGDIENMPVARSYPWSDLEQVRIPDDFLEKPSIKAVLDAIRSLRHKYGHRVAIVGKVVGLEFLVAAGILKTALSPAWNEMLSLGSLIGVRTALNSFVECELKTLDNTTESSAHRCPIRPHLSH